MLQLKTVLDGIAVNTSSVHQLNQKTPQRITGCFNKKNYCKIGVIRQYRMDRNLRAIGNISNKKNDIL